MVWIEKNQALLEKYEGILRVLKGRRIHHQADKAGRIDEMEAAVERLSEAE